VERIDDAGNTALSAPPRRDALGLLVYAGESIRVRSTSRLLVPGDCGIRHCALTALPRRLQPWGGRCLRPVARRAAHLPGSYLADEIVNAANAKRSAASSTIRPSRTFSCTPPITIWGRSTRRAGIASTRPCRQKLAYQLTALGRELAIPSGPWANGPCGAASVLTVRERSNLAAETQPTVLEPFQQAVR
jgi:hypothetical protein